MSSQLTKNLRSKKIVSKKTTRRTPLGETIIKVTKHTSPCPVIGCSEYVKRIYKEKKVNGEFIMDNVNLCGGTMVVCDGCHLKGMIAHDGAGDGRVYVRNEIEGECYDYSPSYSKDESNP